MAPPATVTVTEQAALPPAAWGPPPEATVDLPAPVAPAFTPPPVAPVYEAPSSAYYGSCSDARAAGAAPLYVGEPGYRSGLDRDGDGVACE
jgi:hypothetical protein